MHEFMEKICPLGQYKMLTDTAFLVAELWRLTEENNMEGLRSLAARAAIFVDQTATEGGRSYQLAWLLTGLEEPPFATTEARVARGGVQYAHSRLADPAAVATNRAFLRDMDLVLERTKKYANFGQGHGRARGRGKGKDKGEELEPE